MDAAPWPYANEATRSIEIIEDSLHSPLIPTIFDGSFIEFDVTRDERPPTALERARARWRSARIVEGTP